MSEYKDFIKDFPERCGKLLTDYEGKTDNAVTLMLALASSAIIFPIERLGTESTTKHPARDRERYNVAKKQFDKLLNKNFIPLLGEDGCLKIGKVKSENIIEPHSGWIGNAVVQNANIKIIRILRIMRNSFAHGSLFVEPATKNGEIESLVFLKEVRGKNNCQWFFNSNLLSKLTQFSKEKNLMGEYDFIVIKVGDFRTFISRWIKLLDTLDLSK